MATFTYQRRVYLADTDGAGVVYFNQFLQICHEAYESWLATEDLSLQNLINSGQFAIPLIHAEIDFLAPAHCGDRLLVDLTVQLASSHRFICSYQISLSQQNSLLLLAQAQTHHLCIALPERKKCPLPPTWQRAISNFCDLDHK